MNALPMEAVMIKAMAASCCAVNCSDNINQPATAPTAGSRLNSTLKVSLGKCLSEYISSEYGTALLTKATINPVINQGVSNIVVPAEYKPKGVTTIAAISMPIGVAMAP